MTTDASSAPAPNQASTEALQRPVVPPSPCDCDTDPITGLKRLFVDYFQGVGMAAGRDPATRPVFLRLHGAAHGTFDVKSDLPEELRVGLFARPATYSTWVRFSSDLQPGLPDISGTMGVALKLFGVEGRKALESDPDAPTHDFILQNHDVFFVDTAKDMCVFTCESLHGRGDPYLKQHPVTDQILKEMAKTVPSVFETAYWSVLPFKFGDRHAKYKLIAVGVPTADQPTDYDDAFYLRKDLVERLRQGPATFHFLVQLQTNDQDMPLDQATVRWQEDLSPPIHVGTLTLPQQDLESRGQSNYGEALAFNTWRALPEHAPVGSLAEARKVVYQASADNRRNVNGQPIGEPTSPRPAQYQQGTPYPAAKDTRVVRAAIHPAIGIARVGNSEAGYFVGPQVIEPPVRELGFYRDEKGALKRQAAEFRIYGFNAADDVVRELTADWAHIEWSVQLANKKAAWYEWQMALDIPEASTLAVPRRNPDFLPGGRQPLEIDAGLVTVSGRGAHTKCKGSFTGTEVLIGELLTDSVGRLQVLGGLGVSASPTNSPIFTGSFGNATGWFDDVADGPVTATVTIDGRSIPVEAAWVVSGPPNYAPQLKGVRTLYDLLYDLYVRAGWLPAPSPVSFRADILPLLQRLSGLQWVNAGFASFFGAGGAFDFDNPALQAKLAAKAAVGTFDPNAEVRRQIFNSFRPPDVKDGNQLSWPWLYGDAMDVPAGMSPRQNATITITQWQQLQHWAKGHFESDLHSDVQTPTSIEEVPLADLPATLDRAALEFCLADAFHPGIEVTWPMRHLTLFSRPYRIRHKASDAPPEKDHGATLTQEKALAFDGPLFSQGPGDLTRWMCVPWQADTAWCRSAYSHDYDPFVPTFWPARVPNHVINASDYDVVMDRSQPRAQRIDAFTHRMDWNQPLGNDTSLAMETMVKLYGSMGLLELRPGPVDDRPFPSQMLVASFGPDIPTPPPLGVPPQALQALGGGELPVAADGARVRGANFSSLEEGLRAPRPVQHPKK